MKFGIFLPPYHALNENPAAALDRDLALLACLVLMIGIELTPGRDVLGGRLTDIKLAYGSVGLCALAGFVGSLRVMARCARPEAQPS